MKKAILFLIIWSFPLNILAAGLPDKWQVSKSTHFFIYYKDAPESFITKVSNEAEGHYGKIADELGFSRFNFWLWDDRAKIYISNNAEDYHSQTGQPQWSQGATMPGSKVIQTFVGAKYFFESILPHEMGHIIFREFVGFTNPAVPLWLDEGVASFQEKLKFAGSDKVLREALAKGAFMDIMKLSQFQTYSKKDGESAQVELFYLESFSLVNFLIKKFGRENFVSFCQNLRDRKNLESALASNYNFASLKELDKAWENYIKNG